MTLIQMALAFVINHPAVTAAIIGPRTLEQLESQLGAEEVVLDPALLDRIDEIVPPGTNLNQIDAGRQNPALRARRAPPLPLADPAGARAAARAAALSFVTKFGPVETVCPIDGKRP